MTALLCGPVGKRLSIPTSFKKETESLVLIRKKNSITIPISWPKGEFVSKDTRKIKEYNTMAQLGEVDHACSPGTKEAECGITCIWVLKSSFINTGRSTTKINKQQNKNLGP